MRWLAIDQYGQQHRITGQHPRKALLEHFRRKSARKMYHDRPSDGKVEHIGYIVAGLWLRLYKLEPFARAAWVGGRGRAGANVR